LYLIYKIHNSVDPGVSGGLFLAEKGGEGTQGADFFFEKMEGAKNYNSVDPGVSGGLFHKVKRDGGTQGTDFFTKEIAGANKSAFLSANF